MKRSARIAAVLAVATVATAFGTTWASAATYGTPAAVAADSKQVFTQTTGDCEEGAFDIIFGAITGSRMKEATIVKEAVKLGVLNKVTADGSNWNMLPVLAKHYGLTAKMGSHTLATVEADLKAGDHVEAFVNAETLWATIPVNTLFGQPPAGEAWTPVTPGNAPDHALVLDSIDTTAKTVTVSDTGAGLTYKVTIAQWDSAVSASGYSYGIISGK